MQKPTENSETDVTVAEKTYQRCSLSITFMMEGTFQDGVESLSQVIDSIESYLRPTIQLASTALHVTTVTSDGKGPEPKSVPTKTVRTLDEFLRS